MSAMSFWIWPSLNGETSSAGASTREICVGRWSRQRTRGSISICVQRLARHLAGTNGASRSAHQRAPALEGFRHIEVRHGTKLGIRISIPRRARRVRLGRFLLLPTTQHVIGAVCARALPGGVSPGQCPQTHKTLTQAEGRRGQLDLFGLALEHRGHEAVPRRPGQAQGSSKGQISGIPYP